jgi:hypothetical protein
MALVILMCWTATDLVVSRLVPESRSSKIICLVRLAGEDLRLVSSGSSPMERRP